MAASDTAPPRLELPPSVIRDAISIAGAGVFSRPPAARHSLCSARIDSDCAVAIALDARLRELVRLGLRDPDAVVRPWKLCTVPATAVGGPVRRRTACEYSPAAIHGAPPTADTCHGDSSRGIVYSREPRMRKSSGRSARASRRPGWHGAGRMERGSYAVPDPSPHRQRQAARIPLDPTQSVRPARTVTRGSAPASSSSRPASAARNDVALPESARPAPRRALRASFRCVRQGRHSDRLQALRSRTRGQGALGDARGVAARGSAANRLGRRPSRTTCSLSTSIRLASSCSARARTASPGTRPAGYVAGRSALNSSGAAAARPSRWRRCV